MAKKVEKKSAKTKLTLVEKARILLECFDGDFYGPKDQIMFKIDSPMWALQLMVDFGFGGKGPNIITTYLIMRVCYTINMYPKSSKLEAILEVIEDDITHMEPAKGEMLDWLRVVPSSWDYLTESINANKGANLRGENITLIAYRNYYRFIATKVIEALKALSITS
jgi:hypothetical protein